MRDVKKNLKNWSLPVEVDGDDVVRVFAQCGDECADDTIENFAFDGRISFIEQKRTDGMSARFYFDADGMVLPASPQGMASILDALRGGNIDVDAGCFDGVFTFRNHGGYLSLIAASGVLRSEFGK